MRPIVRLLTNYMKPMVFLRLGLWPLALSCCSSALGKHAAPHRGSATISWSLSMALLAGVVGNCNAQGRSSGKQDLLPYQASENWSYVFANQPVHLTYVRQKASPKLNRIDWEVTVADRQVAHGNVLVKQSIDDNSEAVIVPIQAPDVKPGVVIEGQLELKFRSGDGDTVTRSRKLTIFSDDPFGE